MKVIRNSLIPIGKGFGAVNLFGVLFAKHDMRITPEVMNHELIHSAQMKEMFYLPFYIVYVLEWLVRLVQCKGRAYEAYYKISFEREAYGNSRKPDYLNKRRFFAQWRH